MSLGVISAWRARSGVRGLSLIPRARHVPSGCKPTLLPQPRRLLSSQSPDIEPVAGPDPAGRAPWKSPAVVSPVSLIERLASLPVRQHGPRESVLVEPRIQYPHREETRRSAQKNHEAVTAQLRLDSLRKPQRLPPANWRSVLHTLTQCTPDYSVDVVKMIIPKDASSRLLTDVENSVRDIQSRTGIRLTSTNNEGDGSTSLFLSGEPSAVEIAIDDIVKVAKTGTGILLSRSGRPVMRYYQSPSSPPSESPSSSVEDPTSLSGSVQNHEPRRYVLRKRADSIPRPSSWTRESFEDYVIALTMGRVPATLSASLYPLGTKHDDVVIKLLHQAFNDPNARRSLSISAFKRALSFMATKGRILEPHARALFVRMEIFGMRMDADVFNFLAQSAVKDRDLRNFAAAINLMVSRGHRPNLRTWVLFLRLIKSEEVKRYILQAMHQKHLLNSPYTMFQVVREMAPHDIDRAIQQGKDLKAFLSDQESLYGSNWLSRDAGNKVLEILGRYGRFDDCLAFADVMVQSRFGQPDVVTLNTIITHCKVQGKLRRSVEVLEWFEANTSVVPDATTYHLLSEMGWRRRSPHVTGLVWRYACLVNETTWRMRYRMATLIKAAAAKPISREGQPTAAVQGAGQSTEQAAHEPHAEHLEPPGEQPTQPPARRSGLETMRHMLISDVSGDVSSAAGASAGARVSGHEAMRQTMKWYARRHGEYVPAAPLGGLLMQALGRDSTLHQDLKEGRPAALDPVALPTRRRPAGAGGDRGRLDDHDYDHDPAIVEDWEQSPFEELGGRPAEEKRAGGGADD